MYDARTSISAGFTLTLLYQVNNGLEFFQRNLLLAVSTHIVDTRKVRTFDVNIAYVQLATLPFRSCPQSYMMPRVSLYTIQSQAPSAA
jgi:hypothetical protein